MRDQLLEKVSSPELRTKLFEVANIQLVAALTTARAWKTARRQARRGRKVEREFGAALRKQRKIRRASRTQVLCMWEARELIFHT